MSTPYRVDVPPSEGPLPTPPRGPGVGLWIAVVILALAAGAAGGYLTARRPPVAAPPAAPAQTAPVPTGVVRGADG